MNVLKYFFYASNFIKIKEKNDDRKKTLIK